MRAHPTPAVRISGLRYRWPGSAQDCLAIDALQLGAGERVFLRGPSGSGKTTLLSLVGGVILPQAGTVEVGGQALGALSAGARDRFRADHVGFVFQLFNLLPWLSARDNILLAPGNVFRPQGQPSGYLRFNAGFCADPRLERFLTDVLGGDPSAATPPPGFA
ncbi:MAG TPA: ATP-binding cassette domain-containing protein [Thauera aminoaromatica]|nr:ATP-binding cassette domain-containing protein [Thauera aminoaromatica]